MNENAGQSFIYDATDENFAQLVIENSSKGPVLVNYWSKKVGPCIRQYPVLEKLAQDNAVAIGCGHSFIVFIKVISGAPKSRTLPSSSIICPLEERFENRDKGAVKILLKKLSIVFSHFQT